MIRSLSVILIAITLSFSASSQGSANGHHSLTYGNKVISVTEGHNIRSIKRSVVIRLSEPIDVESLRLLAHRIHKDDPEYQRTFMVYLLPGMIEGNGAWAVTNFDPDLEVEIWGQRVGDKTKSNLIGVKTIGHWFVPYVKYHIWIHERPNGPVLERVFSDGSNDLIELIGIEVPTGRKFKAKTRNDEGDFFVIPQNGRLEIFDEIGLVATLNPYPHK